MGEESQISNYIHSENVLIKFLPVEQIKYLNKYNSVRGKKLMIKILVMVIIDKIFKSNQIPIEIKFNFKIPVDFSF